MTDTAASPNVTSSSSQQTGVIDEASAARQPAGLSQVAGDEISPSRGVPRFVLWGALGTAALLTCWVTAASWYNVWPMYDLERGVCERLQATIDAAQAKLPEGVEAVRAVLTERLPQFADEREALRASYSRKRPFRSALYKTIYQLEQARDAAPEELNEKFTDARVTLHAAKITVRADLAAQGY
jgi:hypothetical protein